MKLNAAAPTVLRPDGRLADHYVDANGAFDKVRDGRRWGRQRRCDRRLGRASDAI